jgi:phage gp36-like protein
MTYATALDLFTRFDANEIAQRVGRGVPRLVSGALLQALGAVPLVPAALDVFTPAELAQGQTAMLVVARALQDADDQINSYLSGRYALPITPVPAVLNRVAAEMARFYLYDDQVTDLVKDRQASNVKWLDGVAKGTISIGVDTATSSQPVSSAGAELVSDSTVWHRAASGAFI